MCLMVNEYLTYKNSQTVCTILHPRYQYVRAPVAVYLHQHSIFSGFGGLHFLNFSHTDRCVVYVVVVLVSSSLNRNDVEYLLMC